MAMAYWPPSFPNEPLWMNHPSSSDELRLGTYFFFGHPHRIHPIVRIVNIIRSLAFHPDLLLNKFVKYKRA